MGIGLPNKWGKKPVGAKIIHPQEWRARIDLGIGFNRQNAESMPALRGFP
jgi:hypothetical protein